MKIEDEIGQRFFSNESHKAQVNLIFTAAWAQFDIAKQLQPLGITPQQFNLLRILRGRYPDPASIRELMGKMLDKSSNASRLVDKLLSKNLVVKSTAQADNRRQEVVITELGLDLLNEASARVETLIATKFSKLNWEETAQLNLILDKLRG